MANKQAAKKTAAKKTAPATPVAKKSAATKELPQPDAKVETKTEKKLSLGEVARRLDAGSRKWGTGRERDNLLASMGYNMNALNAKIREIRGKRLSGS